MNNIIIDIKSKIDQGEGEIHDIDIMTEGEWFEKNSSIYVVYYESEVSGMEGCKTMLKFSGDTITMTRFGGTNSKIIFNESQPMQSAYNTPYGTFDMTVFTEKCTFNLNSETFEGEIAVDYKMILDGVSSSHNELRIKIKRVMDETRH